MTDRFVTRILWLLIMSMIVGSALASLFLCYTGLFRFIARQYESGAGYAGGGLILGVICYILCRHLDDLIDRPPRA